MHITVPDSESVIAVEFEPLVEVESVPIVVSLMAVEVVPVVELLAVVGSAPVFELDSVTVEAPVPVSVVVMLSCPALASFMSGVAPWSDESTPIIEVGSVALSSVGGDALSPGSDAPEASIPVGL